MTEECSCRLGLSSNLHFYAMSCQYYLHIWVVLLRCSFNRQPSRWPKPPTPQPPRRQSKTPPAALANVRPCPKRTFYNIKHPATLVASHLDISALHLGTKTKPEGNTVIRMIQPHLGTSTAPRPGNIWMTQPCVDSVTWQSAVTPNVDGLLRPGGKGATQWVQHVPQNGCFTAGGTPS